MTSNEPANSPRPPFRSAEFSRPRLLQHRSSLDVSPFPSGPSPWLPPSPAAISALQQAITHCFSSVVTQAGIRRSSLGIIPASSKSSLVNAELQIAISVHRRTSSARSPNAAIPDPTFESKAVRSRRLAPGLGYARAARWRRATCRPLARDVHHESRGWAVAREGLIREVLVGARGGSSGCPSLQPPRTRFPRQRGGN